MCVYGNSIPYEALEQWFSQLTFFVPTSMTLLISGQGKERRYNKERFYSGIQDCVTNQKRGLFTLWSSSGSKNEVLFHRDTSVFETHIPISYWDAHKQDIIQIYEHLFFMVTGCVGYAVNCFDDEYVQNPQDVNIYKNYNITEDDYLYIKNIPVIPSDMPGYMPDKLDKRYLPGHRERYNNLIFMTAPYMWFGPDFNTFLSFKILTKFQNCEENIEIVPGYRRLCLWAHMEDYNAKIYRDRQWDFRKALQMDAKIGLIQRRPFKPKTEDATIDPSIEFEVGKFEHGGSLLAKFYVDNKGRAVPKSMAYACIQREMDGDNIVWQERKKV